MFALSLHLINYKRYTFGVNVGYIRLDEWIDVTENKFMVENDIF